MPLRREHRVMNPGPVARHLFVYGTLRPGEERWPFLEPFVVDDGHVDSVGGTLFDTGLGYPAARFDHGGTPSSGRTYGLVEATLDQALAELDRVEGAVRGLYERVLLITAAGLRAWAYQFGSDPHIVLQPIPGGDWLTTA
jgi:gamma-glutamylcyclotransferase (GGCT)/AIG2-like uncharacterized protein YtfP